MQAEGHMLMLDAFALLNGGGCSSFQHAFTEEYS